ncbi:MAG: hypothetical protein QF619_09585, partial [Candidatus Binatia bacterium]|nr:hypothetical protein [Candidatus Binatia bacterium]
MNSGTVGIISTSGAHGKSSAFKCYCPTSGPAGKPNELKCTARGKGRTKGGRSYKATLERAFKDWRKLTMRLEAEARAYGHPGRLPKLSERGLRSFSSRLVATHHANRKQKWRKRVSDDEIIAIAEKLDVREQSNEPAVV